MLLNQYMVFGLLMTARALPSILMQVAKDNGIENPEPLSLSQIADGDVVSTFRTLGFKESQFPIVPSIGTLLGLSDYNAYNLDDYADKVVRRCGADLIDTLLEAIRYHQNEHFLPARAVSTDKNVPLASG